MNAESRRKKIAEIISRSQKPVTGGELAAILKVTRQIVVYDIALLRAGGMPIISTVSGYIMLQSAQQEPCARRVFACRHKTLEDAKKELMIIVENGGLVRDVIVEHPVYGELVGMLMLKSKDAVDALICRLGGRDALMLSTVTDGFHMHTVEAPDEGVLYAIEKRLGKEGLLVDYAGMGE
ncbi:MAG: transcription repressor NadR [Clostridia bacterium]|nr:transcription repressor NadR [Clostridia bacterium]